MAINGLGDFGNIYPGNSINSISKLNFNDVGSSQSKTEESEKVDRASGLVDTAKADAYVYNKADTGRQGSVTASVGKSSSSGFGGLDISRAFSELQQDKVIEGYNVFVGSTKDFAPAFQSMDGKVFVKGYSDT